MQYHAKNRDEMCLDGEATQLAYNKLDDSNEVLTLISGLSKNCNMTFLIYSKFNASSPLILATPIPSPNFSTETPPRDETDSDLDSRPNSVEVGDKGVPLAPETE